MGSIHIVLRAGIGFLAVTGLLFATGAGSTSIAQAAAASTAGAAMPIAATAATTHATHSACGSCHLRNRGTGASSGPAACLDCHDGNEAGMSGPDHLPMPVRAGRHGHSGRLLPASSRRGGEDDVLVCETCHSPHENGRPWRLRTVAGGAVGAGGVRTDTVSLFCLSCHSGMEVAAGPGGHFVRHPLGITVEASRRDRAVLRGLPLVDTAGTEDPSDDVIGCTTCHELHGNDNRFLLRWTEEESRDACGSCHNEVITPPPARIASKLSASGG